MTERELSILVDSSLSTDARIIALALLHRGEEFHELPREEAQDLLSSDAGRDRVQRALQQLERRGYAERKLGGRGHADSFRIKVPENPAPIHPLPTGESGTYADSDRSLRQLNDTVVDVDVDVEEQITPPPLVPPQVEPALLDERTESAIARFGDKLAGCRGALRDYLRDSVPTPARRYAYVNAVATWIDGGDPTVWRLPDGSALPPPERPPLLATALNELAASDERQMKRPVGDTANLRTKINVLLKQRSDYGAGRNGSSDHGTGGTNGGRAATPRQRTPPAAPGLNLNRKRTFGADDDELDNAG